MFQKKLSHVQNWNLLNILITLNQSFQLLLNVLERHNKSDNLSDVSKQFSLETTGVMLSSSSAFIQSENVIMAAFSNWMPDFHFAKCFDLGIYSMILSQQFSPPGSGVEDKYNTESFLTLQRTYLITETQYPWYSHGYLCSSFFILC